MIIPTYEQAKQYEKDYTYIPVCREILADDVTPILMLRKLAARMDSISCWRAWRAAILEDILFWDIIRSCLYPVRMVW